MELNSNEFNAMQGGFKEIIHKQVEMPTLTKMHQLGFTTETTSVGYGFAMKGSV